MTSPGCSRGPSWAADYAERRAEARLRHEREMNAVIEHRNPHLKPTAQWLAGPRLASSVEFWTRERHLLYLTKFTMSKFDPFVRV
jgi:hypothetical protein